MKKNIGALRNILVVTLSNVGDVAVSAPVLRALRERFPASRITVLVGPKAKDVLASSPELDEVIVYDKKIPGLRKLKLALDLRKRKFDCAIDLRNTAFPLIAGARVRTKLIRWGEGRDNPMRERHFKRLRFLGITEFPQTPFEFITSDEKARSAGHLARAGIRASEAFAVIAPGARDEKKRWSAGSYGLLGRRLEREFGLKVLLIGSPDEGAILSRAQAASRGELRVLAEAMSFQEVIGIVSFARLYLGNDSGLLHIAHEMKVPCVGVFGPTNPFESGYHDSLSRTAFPLERNPGDPRGGLDSLTVDAVYEKCRELIAGGEETPAAASALPRLRLAPNPRILVTRIDRIGDVVLTTPVFQILKECYPSCFLGVLVSPQTRELVEGNPYVDRVYVYDKKGDERGAFGTWRFARRIKREKFQAVIHFHATNRVFWVGFLAGIPIRIGHRRKFWRLLTHALEERKREGLRHESDYNLDLLQPLGIARPKAPHPLVPLREEARLSLFRRFPAAAQGPYAILSPSASCISKRWPPERFRATAERLYRSKRIRFFLIGAREDSPLCEEVLYRIKAEAFDLSGCLNLAELAWLIKGARLLISNDSGPVHIASALHVPVISLFGRSDPGLSPARWRPLGEKSFFIHKEIEGSEEAFDYRTPSRRLLALTPEEVAGLAEKLL